MAKKTTTKEKPQTERESGGYGKGQFKPVDYDAGEIMPDAEPGKYGLKVADMKVKPHKESQFPMLIIECEIVSADDTDNEKYVGGTISRFITIYPDNDRRGNFGKQILQAFAEATGVSLKLIPKRIVKMADFKPFIEASKGKHIDGWVTQREYQGQTMTNVDFADPEGGDPGFEVEEEEEEETEPESERQPVRRSGGRKR